MSQVRELTDEQLDRVLRVMTEPDPLGDYLQTIGRQARTLGKCSLFIEHADQFMQSVEQAMRTGRGRRRLRLEIAQLRQELGRLAADRNLYPRGYDVPGSPAKGGAA